jgi:hypothetical protein
MRLDPWMRCRRLWHLVTVVVACPVFRVVLWTSSIYSTPRDYALGCAVISQLSLLKSLPARLGKRRQHQPDLSAIKRKSKIALEVCQTVPEHHEQPDP